MKTNKFGTKIPETDEEFWELYDAFEITYVPMVNKYQEDIEVASYEVVKYLMQGYNLNHFRDQTLIAVRNELAFRMNNEIPF